MIGVVILAISLVIISNYPLTYEGFETEQKQLKQVKSGLLHSRSPFSSIYNENTSIRCENKQVPYFSDKKQIENIITNDNTKGVLCKYELKYDGIHNV